MKLYRIIISAVVCSVLFGGTCLSQQPGTVATGQSPGTGMEWSNTIEIEPTEEEKSNENTAASGWDAQKAASSTGKIIKYEYSSGVGNGFSIEGQMYRRSIEQLWKWLDRTTYEHVLNMTFAELLKMLPEELQKKVIRATSNKNMMGMKLKDFLKISPEELQKEEMESTTYEKLLGMSLMEFFSVLYETDCWVSLNEFHRYKVRRNQAEEASKGHGSLEDYGSSSKKDEQ